MGGFASSRVLEVHGERMINRTFDLGFKIELHQKDLSLALDSARSIGAALPNTATTQQLFNSCAAASSNRPNYDARPPVAWLTGVVPRPRQPHSNLR